MIVDLVIGPALNLLLLFQPSHVGSRKSKVREVKQTDERASLMKITSTGKHAMEFHHKPVLKRQTNAPPPSECSFPQTPRSKRHER